MGGLLFNYGQLLKAADPDDHYRDEYNKRFESKLVLGCELCGGDLYESDDVYIIEDTIVCEECMQKSKVNVKEYLEEIGL